MKRQTNLRWFDPTHDFQVGETVVMTDVNGKPKEVTVVKVGRKLLHVKVHGWTHAFRMDQPGGRPSNDDYQHQSILTLEEVAYRQKVRDAAAALKAAGIQVDQPHTWPIERLKAILRAIGPAPFPEGDHS